MVEIVQLINTGAVLICGLLVLNNISKNNPKGNLWLGVFLLCLFAQLLHNLNLNLDFYKISSIHSFITILSLFTIPIAFYLSILFFVSPNRTFKPKDGFHFLIHLFYLVLAFIFYHKNGVFLDLMEDNLNFPLGTLFFNSLFCLFLVVTLIYWVMGFLKLRKYSSLTGYYSAAEEEVNLQWLHHVNYWYLCMTLLWILSILTENYWAFLVANAAYFIGSYYIVWNSLKQSELFPEDENEKLQLQSFINEQSLPKTDKKPEYDALPNEYLQLKNRVLNYMENEKPYLDNDINLIRLANRLAISHHKLSYLLNHVIETNFSSFVNSYRAEEAKRIMLLPEKQHYTMLQIAYEAGYNSKTVFNTHFKKVTNLTPSQFKKQQ